MPTDREQAVDALLAARQILETRVYVRAEALKPIQPGADVHGLPFYLVELREVLAMALLQMETVRDRAQNGPPDGEGDGTLTEPAWTRLRDTCAVLKPAMDVLWPGWRTQMEERK